jgi:hypothetical protein
MDWWWLRTAVGFSSGGDVLAGCFENEKSAGRWTYLIIFSSVKTFRP